MADENSQDPRVMERKIARKKAERIADYQRTFTSDPGKKVLQDLFARYGMAETQAMDNPYQTYFHEGQRSVVLFICKVLKMNPNEILERIQALGNEQE